MRLKSNNLLLTIDKQFPLQMPTKNWKIWNYIWCTFIHTFIYIYFTVQYNNDSHDIEMHKEGKIPKHDLKKKTAKIKRVEKKGKV